MACPLLDAWQALSGKVIRVLLRFCSLVLAGALALGATTAQARLVGVRDSFETGQNSGWVSNGDVRLITRTKGQTGLKAHSGNGFVVLTNPLPFPGAALTTFATLKAAKGAACSLDLWVQAPGQSGALAISVREGGPVGTLLASRTIPAPAVSKARRTQGYNAVRLNFAHSGTAFFVSLDAIGPVEIAIDDFALTCRSR